MNKREKKELARNIQEGVLLFAELPKDSREFRMQSIKARNPAATVGEYHYLRITIDDLDTGQTVIGPIFTYRKPTDFDAVKDAMVRIAVWPDELLAGIVWSEFVLAGGDRLRGPITGLKLQKKQTLGGRRIGSKSPKKTKTDYSYHARQFYKSGLSQREYSKESGISRSTLQRALKAQNVPQKR